MTEELEDLETMEAEFLAEEEDLLTILLLEDLEEETEINVKQASHLQ